MWKGIPSLKGLYAMISKEHSMPRGENSNFRVEKTGKHYISQMIKVTLKVILIDATVSVPYGCCDRLPQT